MSTESHLLYSQLPAIDRLLREPAIEPLVAQHGQTLIGELLRRLQAEARAAIKQQQRLPAGATTGRRRCGRSWPGSNARLCCRCSTSAAPCCTPTSGAPCWRSR